MWYTCFTSAVQCLHCLHKLVGCVHLRISSFCRFFSHVSFLLSAPCIVWYITSKGPGANLSYTQCTFPILSPHVCCLWSFLSVCYTVLILSLFPQSLFCSSVACFRAKLSLLGVSMLGCGWPCLCWDSDGASGQKDFITGICRCEGNWAGGRTPIFVALCLLSQCKNNNQHPHPHVWMNFCQVLECLK